MPPKNRNKRQQFPWPIFVFGIILLASAVILYANQKRDSGTPSLAVNTELIDFGAVKLNESRAFSIEVSNTGNGVLRFQEKPYIEVLEGC